MGHFTSVTISTKNGNSVVIMNATLSILNLNDNDHAIKIICEKTYENLASVLELNSDFDVNEEDITTDTTIEYIQMVKV